jgi:8-oxo-dGTP pyrophosphatase MutT (NUDIX family)
MSSRRGPKRKGKATRKVEAKREGQATHGAEAKRGAEPKRSAEPKRRAAAKPRAATSQPKRRGPARERSAGGVVVRGDEVIVIVPTRRAFDGSRVLALPKGHIDPGETALQAAEREVREETGVTAAPVRELGEARYWYRREGQTIPKSVSFFLFSYVAGSTHDHDDEVEEVRWIGLERAQSELSHAAEREMVALAVDYLEEDRKDR